MIIRYKGNQAYYSYGGTPRWIYDEIFNEGNRVGRKTQKHFPFLQDLGKIDETDLPKDAEYKEYY